MPERIKTNMSEASWFTEGFEAAEKMSSQGSRRNRRNFWTKPGESAVVRFLRPAKVSVNYKRAFVPWAKGQKLYTSPGSPPDPLAEHPKLSLQSAFAWPILDRRKLKFDVEEEGKTVQKEIGPRVLYFADGQRTRKALISFEKEMREQINEERAEEGLKPLSEDEYNLTHFDIKLKKDKDAPWQMFAIKGGKPKDLSSADNDLIEKASFDLKKELAPLSVGELRAIVSQGDDTSKEAETTTYSYGDDDEGTEEEGNFFKQ